MKKVVLVEEDKDRAEMLLEIMKNDYNIDIKLFVNAYNGYRAIVKGDYNIVLLDVMMPRIKEYEKFEYDSTEIPLERGNYTGVHLLRRLKEEFKDDKNIRKYALISAQPESIIRPYIKDDYAYDRYFYKSVYTFNELAEFINS